MSTLLERSPLLSKFIDDDLISFPESFLAQTRRLFPDRAFTNGELFVPAVNIKDNGKDFTLEVAVPGYRKEDLKVKVKDGVLTISSERKEEHEEKKKGWTRREWSQSAFSRSFTLPGTVDEKSVDASFKDGVLTLTLKKTKAAAETEGQSIVIR
jgi:HSP20 family protein